LISAAKELNDISVERMTPDWPSLLKKFEKGILLTVSVVGKTSQKEAGISDQRLCKENLTPKPPGFQ
jgi:hypothetical protein